MFSEGRRRSLHLRRLFELQRVPHTTHPKTNARPSGEGLDHAGPGSRVDPRTPSEGPGARSPNEARRTTYRRWQKSSADQNTGTGSSPKRRHAERGRFCRGSKS
ncbi:hypothetical protein GN956_G6443 [Arapaima gigas]